MVEPHRWKERDIYESSHGRPGQTPTTTTILVRAPVKGPWLIRYLCSWNWTPTNPTIKGEPSNHKQKSYSSSKFNPKISTQNSKLVKWGPSKMMRPRPYRETGIFTSPWLYMNKNKGADRLEEREWKTFCNSEWPSGKYHCLHWHPLWSWPSPIILQWKGLEV